MSAVEGFCWWMFLVGLVLGISMLLASNGYGVCFLVLAYYARRWSVIHQYYPWTMKPGPVPIWKLW